MDNILLVLVTYNAMKWADKCFSSIYTSTIPLDVFVVDNGSTDGTQEYIKANYPQVRFVQSECNLGFGKANNLGLRYALDNNYDYVYLLNQDAWLMTDTIEKLISIHKKYPKYGILSPYQLQGNMKHLDKNFVSEVCKYEANNYILDDFYFSRPEEVYPVPMVMAAHWLISKECIKTVGGFSPTFPHYGEDNNYSNRALYHNFNIGIVPFVTAIHDRENRVISFDRKIYMVYIGILIELSKIHQPLSHKFLICLQRTFSGILHYKSFLPLKYLVKIISHWYSIKKNTLLSAKEKTAFL